MGRYRTINVDLNRQYRNDLNANFSQIEADILGLQDFTVDQKDEMLLELSRIERESKERDDLLAGQSLEVLLQSIEDAKANANTSAANADIKAGHAQTQGDYAKTQGDYAKTQGDYAQLKGTYADEKAIAADQAAGNANLEASNLSALKVAVADATQNANTQANAAGTSANNADVKAEYARTQGEYAKLQGDRAKDVVETAPVVSVNGKKGVVELTSTDMGAIPASEKGLANGVAKLNDAGKVIDASGNEVEGKVKTVNNVEPDTSGNIAITKTSVGLGSTPNAGYATQAQAEAGTVSTTLMTPLRTKQAIDKLVQPVADASTATKGIVQLNDSVSSTLTTQAATANAVKTAMDRADAAFTQASDGKTAVASAVTAKGVAASPADTFLTLATKIGQISTGKKWESGTVSASANTITVTGLSFQPSMILAILSAGNQITMAIYASGNYSSNSQILSFHTNNVGTIIKSTPTITSNGFSLPIFLYGSYKWMALE